MKLTLSNVKEIKRNSNSPLTKRREYAQTKQYFAF